MGLLQDCSLKSESCSLPLSLPEAAIKYAPDSVFKLQGATFSFPNNHILT